MPEVNFTPSQCTLSDPTDGADLPFATTEPARPALDQPLACYDPSPGADGGSSDCAEELVRRFGGEGGAPGTSGPVTTSESHGSCADDLLRAVGNCGAAAVAVATRGAALSVGFSGAGCLGAIGGLVECELKSDDAVR